MTILTSSIIGTEYILELDLDKQLISLKDGNVTLLKKPIGATRGKYKSIMELGSKSDEYKYFTSRLESLKEEVNSMIFEDAWNELKMIYMDFLSELNDPEAIEERSKQERELEESKTLKRFKEVASEAKDFFSGIKNPLQFISDELEWVTAGEKIGIMYSWLAYCSQIILKHPVSVIGIGEASSGKSHIQDVALGMIPEEYIYQVKSITEAVLYGKAMQDPYFFDGKIVNIGDMGGRDDHKETHDFKNAMKEMQTDGYTRREKMVDGKDGLREQVFELYGFPCLTYTNVPNYSYEDQEKSRSIFITTRTDNRRAVGVFKQYNRVKSGLMYSKIDEHGERLNMVEKLVLALRLRMEDVDIYNPYYSFIEDFLKDNKNFKRDVDTYTAILNVITAVNGYNRKLFEINGKKVLFTTSNDIHIFLDILDRYMESIQSNTTPGATDILNIMKEEGIYEMEDAVSSIQFINQFKCDYSDSSVNTYMHELKKLGKLSVSSEKDGRKNRYYVTENVTIKEKPVIRLNKEDQQMLRDNYGINDIRDFEVNDTTIKLLNTNIELPPWYYRLPEVIDAKKLEKNPMQSGFG